MKRSTPRVALLHEAGVPTPAPEHVDMGFFDIFFGRPDPAFAERVRAAVAAGARVVDVRSPGEFASGHVPGAINVPVHELGRRLGELGPVDAPVVLYCASGARSASAAQALRRAGFAEVLDVGPMRAYPA